MEAPGKYTVEIPINTDDSGMERAIAIAGELAEVAEVIEQSMTKASSLLNELAECQKTVEVELCDPIWTDTTSEE